MKYAIVNPEGIAVAFYDKSIHESIPGGAIEITDEQWQEYLSDQHNKRFSGGQLITRVKPLDELKAQKIAEVKAKRLEKSEAGIVFNGTVVPTDKEAIVLLTASQIYLKDKPNKKIKRASLGELTGAQVDALIEAIGQLYDAMFANEADLYEDIMAATTPEELDAIDIEAGW